MAKTAWVVVLASMMLLGAQTAAAFDLTVVITSQPVLTGQTDGLYTYDVDATASNPAAVITYTLRGNPPVGMLIDAATGLISWTPSMAGRFPIRIRVKARLNNAANGAQEAEAEQEYPLTISGGGGGATAHLQGTVTDRSGNGVRSVEIKMFDTEGRRVLYRTHSDSTGAYAIGSVAVGTYFLKADVAEMRGLEDQWFDGVRRFEDATPLVMGESSSVTIDFVLAGRDSDDARFDVSGTVRDSSGSPIAHARVTFTRDDDHGGDDEGDDNSHARRGGDDHGHGHNGDDNFFTVTDSTGTYHIQLRGRSYIVAAWAQGFRKQYWNHKDTRAAANLLKPMSDSTGIDFDLMPVTAGRAARTATARLGQNYPNPFNPSTSIAFVLPEAGRARLTVYTLLGQEIATLVNGELQAGEHSVAWRADNVASGFYFYRLEYGGAAQVRQMMLVR